MKQQGAAEEGYKIVSGAVSSFLRDQGYKKRGSVSWKDQGVVRNFVELQRSQRSDRACVIFTVNLSIVLKEFVDPEIDDLDKMRGHEGHLYWRIGDFLSPKADKWWTVTESTDAASTAQEICSVLSEKALRQYEQYNSVDAVVGLLCSDDHPPMAEKRRTDFISDLTRVRTH